MPWEQYWTSPGSNTPQGTNNTVTYHLSRKTIQARRTRHAGHCWRSKDELISDVILWIPALWPIKSRTTSSNIHTYSSYVMIWDVTLKTCQRRWMIGRCGEREGQGYPCWPHDMMIMMNTFFHQYNKIITNSFRLDIILTIICTSNVCINSLQLTVLWLCIFHKIIYNTHITYKKKIACFYHKCLY